MGLLVVQGRVAKQNGEGECIAGMTDSQVKSLAICEVTFDCIIIQIKLCVLDNDVVCGG